MSFLIYLTYKIVAFFNFSIHFEIWWHRKDTKTLGTTGEENEQRLCTGYYWPVKMHIDLLWGNLPSVHS